VVMLIEDLTDLGNLEAELARYVVRNFPPAAVWRYRRKS